MDSIAPNLKLLVGSSLGAKLISHAGGLKRLATYPSSTVQIMGAEKALFRHLKSGDRPPKYGLIYQHPQVRGAKWWNRGKIARLLAGRISLAVRKDVFTHDFNPEIFNEFSERVEEIEKNTNVSLVSIPKTVCNEVLRKGYKKVGLDLIPSPNGLVISVSATGETSLLTAKRRPAAKSMDLICISGNIGASYLGFQVLEREKRKFEKSGDAKAQPNLEDYKGQVGAYLRPQINPGIIGQMEDAEIIPSYGYLVNRGLADTIKRLVSDSGLGAKIYVDRLPFAGNTFELGKELDIDPMSAALNGGDDYRLLFTIPIGKHDKFRHDFQTFDIIGHLAKPEVGAALVTPDGVELPMKAQGWK